MSDDENIRTWTERLLSEVPELSPEKARRFVHDLYFAAQRALDTERGEADFEREE
ncbi:MULTISPECIES: hypothetical protein [Streptomyces]|uniref:hypothetical protein n=1 Tax=Streptomyces TaxID=1883 RepID=UPI0018EFFB1B|nr:MULTISPECIES: hypothetical protein [Streptomyces]